MTIEEIINGLENMKIGNSCGYTDATEIFDTAIKCIKLVTVENKNNATNGEIIKTLFPNMCKKGTYCEFFFDNKKAVQTNSYMHVSEHWWNEPYKIEGGDK